jgi:hypothetical protein
MEALFVFGSFDKTPIRLRAFLSLLVWNKSFHQNEFELRDESIFKLWVVQKVMGYFTPLMGSLFTDEPLDERSQPNLFDYD